MESNFNTKLFWENNKHLIVDDERMNLFAQEKLGMIAQVNTNIGNKQTISYSEISTFASCRRKHNLEYKQLITRKVTKNYFFIGGVLHDCLEYLYTLKFYNIAFDTQDIINFFEFLTEFKIQKDKVDHPDQIADIELLEFEVNKGYAIISVYMSFVLPNDEFEMIPQTDDPNKPFLETIFCNPVLTPNGNKSTKFLHTGKIDGLVMLNGAYYLFEHKFLAAFDSSDVEWLPKDLQVLSYVYAMQEKYGIHIQGIVYNVCRKPKLRQKKTETVTEFRDRILMDLSDRPEHYFERFTVMVNQENVADIPHYIYENCKEIPSARPLPASVFICKRSGCYFKEVCLSDNPNEVLEANFRRKDKKHEEL